MILISDKLIQANYFGCSVFIVQTISIIYYLL